MTCPVTAVNVVWQATTSHEVLAKPKAVMEEAEHMTDTTTDPANSTPTDSNDPPPRTLLRQSQVVTDKAAPALSVRTKRHDRMHTSDHWDGREEREMEEAVQCVVNARGAQRREQRGQDRGGGMTRRSNSRHDNHQDRMTPCDTESKRL